MKKIERYTLLLLIFIMTLFSSVDVAASISLDADTSFCVQNTSATISSETALINSCDIAILDSCRATQLQAAKTVSFPTLRYITLALVFLLSATFFHIFKRNIFSYDCQKRITALFYLTCLQILYQTDGKKRLSFCCLIK